MNISLLRFIIEKCRPTVLTFIVSVAVLISVLAPDCHAIELRQKRFQTPDEAVQALVAATRTDDLTSMLTILGPGSKELISSGDNVADNAGRDQFITAYEQKHSLEARLPGIMILHVGADDWPLPIPIVKKGNSWGFDIGKGKKEILNRRIGRNELQAIDVVNAYVEAQQEYASRDCRGGGKVEFAQRFSSTPGSRDGLYWEAKEGELQSPLGPLIARAAQEGYSSDGILSPFHGYYFKIIRGQGKHAKGGAYEYMVKDKMILGFALVAYPAEYGNSGIMTFVVNQEGTIFEKDLGKNTRRIAEAITVYNPDKSWKKVKEPATSAKK
jgi:hypothetical protein